MKTLPKEFILTNFAIDEMNEVLKHHFSYRLRTHWTYLIIRENNWDVFSSLSNQYSHLPRISYQQWKELVSSEKRFNYTNSREDIFYKIIYPLFPKEFLFGNDLEEFLKLVNETFILNDIQLEIIVEHWKEKEKILV